MFRILYSAEQILWLRAS